MGAAPPNSLHNFAIRRPQRKPWLPPSAQSCDEHEQERVQEEPNVEASMAADNESLILNRVAYRFIPFLILCYFVNYLDRVNVGFAKLTMDTDLGLSDTAFGFGAGIFFLAYFLFEVPSNVIMDRVGARIWIARIMLSWGIVSGAMAFIPQICDWNWFF
jgi:sugar phosphate permease